MYQIKYHFTLQQEKIIIDDALKKVGDSNRYQVGLFIVFSIQWFSQAFLLIGPTYLYITPPLQCNGNPQPCSSQFSEEQICEMYSHVSIDFLQLKYKNPVSEFNLICSNEIYVSVVSSSLFLGSVLGTLAFCYFGDTLGRRSMLILSWGVTCIGIIGVNTSFSIWQMIIFNFIVGFGLNGAFNINIVIINESCGQKFRQKATIGLLITFGLTEIFCALIFWCVTEWRTLYSCFITIPALIGLALSFFVLETPKYHLIRGKNDLALETLNTIANINKKNQLPENTQILFIIPQHEQTENLTNYELDSIQRISSSTQNLEFSPDRLYGYQHLFTFKSLKSDTLGLMGMMFALQLLYYGGQYGLNQISTGNTLYQLGALVGATELISYILVILFVEKLPRRKSIFFTILLSILLCLVYWFFGWNYKSIDISDNCEFCSKKIIIIIMACVMRLMVSVGFGLEPLYANEIYPTKIRTIGSGFVFAIGLLGGFICPYIFQIGEIINLNPFVILFVIASIGPIATWFIRETQGEPLEDEIREVLEQQKQAKI